MAKTTNMGYWTRVLTERDRVSSVDLKDRIFGLFRKFLERYPEKEISEAAASGEDGAEARALYDFLVADQMTALEYDVGDIVRIVSGLGDLNGTIAVVTEVGFIHDCCSVRISCENGATNLVDGSTIEKSRIPQAIITAAAKQIAVRTSGRCPLMEEVACPR